MGRSRNYRNTGFSNNEPQQFRHNKHTHPRNFSNIEAKFQLFFRHNVFYGVFLHNKSMHSHLVPSYPWILSSEGNATRPGQMFQINNCSRIKREPALCYNLSSFNNFQTHVKFKITLISKHQVLKHPRRLAIHKPQLLISQQLKLRYAQFFWAYWKL